MRRLLVLLFLSFFSCVSVAQSVDVSVLIDQGGSGGCTVAAVDPVSGVDARLTASVDSATAQVDALTLETCQSGAFGAPQTLDGGYPVGLNNGEGGGDVVELSVDAAELGSGSAQYSFTMMADDGSSLDEASGSGLGIAVPVPLAPWAMLLLAVVLALIALWALSRHRGPTALLLGLLAIPALAAHFMLDGEIADWTGVSVISDPAGDATAGGNRADILAVFTAEEGGRLWFRVDLADIENAAPTAADDTLTTDEDTILTGENVLADNGSGADSDPDGDTLTVTGFDATSAEGATVTIAANGDLDYDPTGVGALQALAVGESQDDTFTYTIEDPDGSSDTATVTVTVDGVNDEPTASDDAFATDKNTPITTTSVLANDTDPDSSDTLSVDSIDTTGTQGSVTDNGDGTFDYDPNGQFDSLGDGDSDTDTFTYTVTDSNGGTDTAMVTITISGDNTAPAATDDAFATDEDSALTTGDVLANDTDAEGDALSVDSIDTTGTVGSVTDNGDGTFVYDPNGQFEALAQGDSDTDSFTYTVSDGNGGTDTATVTITINGVNDAPTADASTATMNEDTAVTITLSGSDVDGDALTFAIASSPSDGSLGGITQINDTTAEVTYTPAADFNGSDSFTYTANDSTVDSPAAAVSITVNAVNDAPSFTASNPPAVDEDAGAQTVNGWVTSFDPGPANEAGQSVAGYTVSNVSNDALFSAGPSVDNAGNLTYTPATDAFGTSDFDVAVQDDGGTPNGGTDTSPAQTFTITVNAVDDPPVAVDDTATVIEDDPATTITVLANDTDIDGGPISIASVTQPANGTVVNNTADLTYEPNADLCNDGSPTDDFTYTLNGGSMASVAVTVTCVNDPPVLTFPTAGVIFDASTGPVNLDPAATLSDIDSSQFSRVETTLDIGGTCDPDDSLGVENQGTGAGQIGFNGTTVTFGGTAISTSVQPWACTDAGTGAQDAFIIELDTNAGQAATEALLRALQFSSTSADSTSRSAEVVVTDDGGATDSAVQTISLDEPPEASSPVDNETNLDPAAGVTVNFSENVDIDAGAFTFECDSTPVAFTTSPALPATGIATINLIPDADLTPGAVCTVTVTAANVRDSDTIDPPDNMVADAVFGFVVEAPPQVDALSPADGSTNVEPGANMVIGFDEPVDLNADWFSLQCGATTFSPGNANVTVTSNDSTNTQVTLNPDSDFGFGENCVLDIFADATNGVNDQDGADGPGLDTLDGNGDGTGGDDFTASFDVEAAPEVTATTPADTATDIAGDTDIVIDFSEPVTAGAGAFVLECPGSIGLTANANVDQDQYTLTPDTDLPGGETCTVTVVADQISDADTIDPPDNLDGNGNGTLEGSPTDDFAFSFTIDEAPALDSVQAEVENTLTTVSDGTTLDNVDNDTTVVLGFSEPVNVTNDGVSLSCTSSGPLATPTALTVTGDGTATITLTRASGTFSGGETCTLGFDVTEINDTDANDPPDNLEPVAGTFAFEIAPVVNDDARTVTAHLQATYTDGTAGGNDDHLLVNDNCGGCTLSFGETDATANAAGTTATFSDGAIVTVNSDGSFTYNPPPGLGSGATDTFVYRLTTGNGGFDEATVTMTVDGPVIWFVDSNNASGTENGTLAFPFSDFGGASPSFDADAADAAGQAIFIDNGGAAYTCGVTVLDNQQLIGDGSSATLQTLTGIAPVAESTSTLPTPSGTDPVLSTTGGDCLTLAAGNTVRGFAIGATPAANHAMVGNGFGTLTVDEVSISGDGGLLELTNGTLAGGGFESLASTSSATAIDLDQVGGSLVTTTTTISGATAGIDITNSSGTFTFNATSVGSSGTGVNVASSGSAVTLFSTLAITTTGGAGLDAVTAGEIFITASSGSSISASGGPAITAAATGISNGIGGSAVFDGLTSSGSTDAALRLDSVSGGLTANGGSLSNSSAVVAVVEINNNSAFILNLAASITNPGASGGNAVEAQGNSGGGYTLSGAIDDDASGIDVTNNTGGAFFFSGTSKTLTTGANTAVNLASNTAPATINFINGGLDIDTTSGTGFSATGGGTVVVSGAANTVDSTTGTGVNIANTTIGASGVTFQSVSVNGASAGIVLNTTGSTGHFEVTGDGPSSTADTTAGRTASAAGGGTLGLGSGGTIINTTDGLRLTNASNVTLRNMVIGNGAVTQNDAVSTATSITDNGIEMVSVADLTLDNVIISETGDHGILGTGSNSGLTMIHTEIFNAGNEGSDADGGDDAMQFGFASGSDTLTGTVTFTSVSIAGMSDTGMEVENTSGDLDLTVTDSFIGNNDHSDASCNPCEGDGFLLRADGGSATIDMVVRNTTFNDIANDGIDLGNDQASNVTTLIAENVVGTNNDGADNLIDTANTNGTLRAQVTGLTSDSAHRGTVLFFKADGAATTDVTVSNSTIQGSDIGNGIEVFVDGNPGDNVLADGNARVLIENTDISNIDSMSIDLNVQDMPTGSSTAGFLDATLENVTTAEPLRDGLIGSVRGVADSGDGAGATLQLQIINSVIGLGSFSSTFGFRESSLVFTGDSNIDVACVDDGNAGNGTPCTNINSTTSDDGVVADVMNENGNQVDDGGARAFAAGDVFTSGGLRGSTGEVLIISPTEVTNPTLP